MVGALGRVSVLLHRAGRCLWRGEGIADTRGAEGRGGRLSIRRRSRPGGDARRSEVVGRDLLEGGRRLRWSAWIRPRRRVGRGRSKRPLRRLLRAVVYRHVANRRWVRLVVVAKGLVRVRLHRRGRHHHRRRRRLARRRHHRRRVVVQDAPKINRGGMSALAACSQPLLVPSVRWLMSRGPSRPRSSHQVNAASRSLALFYVAAVLT